MTKKNKKGLIRTPPTFEREKAIEEAYERDMDKDDLTQKLTEYAEECFPTPLVNFGGAIKRNQALRLCVKQVWLLKRGSIDDLITRLQKILGLTERRIREDYVKDLFKFGIIQRLGSSWRYIGKNFEDSETFMEYAKKKQQKKEDLIHG